MKVNTILTSAIDKKQFAGVHLQYQVGNYTTEVKLNIGYENIYYFTHIKSGITFDLFLLGAVVYGTDILLPRNDSEISENHWSREIELHLPVENPDTWNRQKKQINFLLSFLTGDEWNIIFEQRPRDIKMFGGLKKVLKEEVRKSYELLCLFSGGLDSLVGSIDKLFTGKKVVLVSHYDAVFKGAHNDQKEILSELTNKYHNFFDVQTRIDLTPYDQLENKIEKETSLRSRSFMFLTQAVLIAHSIDENMIIYIPENGTISLNHPLTPSRQGSCSTRTTHPLVIDNFNSLLILLGINNHVVNPFQMFTKGEILKQCSDKDMLEKTYKLSCSCGKRGTRKDVRDNANAHNCGVCMPCIYRRVALFGMGWDNEPIGTDIFHPQKRKLLDIPDMPAFIDFMRHNYAKEDIKRNLLVNGSLPLQDADKFADVVVRTRYEIREWIRAKGSEEIKHMLQL
jgi:7-cyano-7-deazaguanine synthase in queuosine biosynthesis